MKTALLHIGSSSTRSKSLDRDRWVDSPALSARGPDLPCTTQDEAGLMGKFATCRKTPISRSALDKNPMLGHLLEGSLEYEGTTLRGTNTPVHQPEKRAGYIHSSTSGLSPREQLERQEESHPPEKTRPDSPVPTCRDLAI